MEKRGIIVSGMGSLLAFVAGGSVLAIATFGHVNLSSVVFLGIGVLFAVSVALGFVAWLLGLMKTARISRWDWFVVVLVLGAPGALLYGFGGPAGRSHPLVSSRRRDSMAYMH